MTNRKALRKLSDAELARLAAEQIVSICDAVFDAIRVKWEPNKREDLLKRLEHDWFYWLKQEDK